MTRSDKKVFNIEQIERWRNKDKLSWFVIADFLECHVSTLLRFIEENKLTFDIKIAPAERKPYNTKANKTAWEHGYRDIREMVADLRRSGKTKEEVSEITGLHVSNIGRYQPREMTGEIFIYTEKKRKSDINNLRKAQIGAQKKRFDGEYWSQRFNKNTQRSISLEEMAKARLKIFGGDMSADELGRELEAKQPKGKGMFFTSKDLLTGKEITIEVQTGAFLSKAYGYLVKGLTVNPPFSVSNPKVKRKKTRKVSKKQ